MVFSSYISFSLILLLELLCHSYVQGFPKVKNAGDDSVFAFFSRDDWGAAVSTDSRPLNTPVPYVVIHHTAVPGACHTSRQCQTSMRSMQNYHQSLGWGDIGYNFCVGSEGGAYEGRGWHVVGIHAMSANNHSVGICLIGDWRVETPPFEQLKTTQLLIEEGLQLGIISPTYKLIGHNQATPTECPGQALQDVISKWPHYSSDHFQIPKASFQNLSS